MLKAWAGAWVKLWHSELAKGTFGSRAKNSRGDPSCLPVFRRDVALERVADAQSTHPDL